MVSRTTKLVDMAPIDALRNKIKTFLYSIEVNEQVGTQKLSSM